MYLCQITPSTCGSAVRPLRPGIILFYFSHWKIADIQAHSAAPSAALRACRSAIFERNRENVLQVFECCDPIP